LDDAIGLNCASRIGKGGTMGKRRTTMTSPSGTKLYAVRDERGKFEEGEERREEHDPQGSAEKNRDEGHPKDGRERDLRTAARTM
jgi:hypothetical protein